MVQMPVSRKPACGKLPCRIDSREDRSSLVGPETNHYCFGQLSGMRHARHNSCYTTGGATSSTPLSSCGDCRHGGSAPYRLQAPSWSLPRAKHRTRVSHNRPGHTTSHHQFQFGLHPSGIRNARAQLPLPPPPFCPRLLKFLP